MPKDVSMHLQLSHHDLSPASNIASLRSEQRLATLELMTQPFRPPRWRLSRYSLFNLSTIQTIPSSPTIFIQAEHHRLARLLPFFTSSFPHLVEIDEDHEELSYLRGFSRLHMLRLIVSHIRMSHCRRGLRALPAYACEWCCVNSNTSTPFPRVLK